MSNVTIKGLDAVLERLSPVRHREKIKNALNVYAGKVEETAKQIAPKDEGALANSIGVINAQTNKLTASIVCRANYAAYVEFGTRKYAAAYVDTLPQTWQELAAQHQGKGRGDFYDFLNAILDWVMRKGIANRYSVATQKAIPIKIGGKGEVSKSDQDRLEETAYAIALSILRNGVKPHPFLYPAVNKHTNSLLNDLRVI